jgi:hypothetical protein
VPELFYKTWHYHFQQSILQNVANGFKYKQTNWKFPALLNNDITYIRYIH